MYRHFFEECQKYVIKARRDESSGRNVGAEKEEDNLKVCAASKGFYFKSRNDDMTATKSTVQCYKMRVTNFLINRCDIKDVLEMN